MADRLKGKVAFCTASGAGIGRATAMAFAREGAQVIASDLNEAALAGLKEAGVAECVKLDARDTAAIEAQAKRLGPVDVLFNAAGFVHHGTVLDCSEKDWDFSFDLNVKSMHRTIKAFLPGMLGKGRGSIVNIASAVGREQGRAQPLRLRRHQGSRRRPHQGGGASTSSARASAATASAPAPSRPLARRPHQGAGRPGRRRGQGARACSSSASRWAGSARPRRWRTSPSTWPPTSPPTPPAPPSSADGGFTL